MMDIEYTLISFASGLVLESVAEGVIMINRDIVSTTEEVLYPFIQNTYYQVYNQLPPNAIQARDAVNKIYHHALTYIQQDANYSTASINTLVATLQITSFIDIFIIILEILTRLAMPRTEGPSGY
jgi:hypothetical protein